MYCTCTILYHIFSAAHVNTKVGRKARGDVTDGPQWVDGMTDWRSSRMPTQVLGTAGAGCGTFGAATERGERGTR